MTALWIKVTSQNSILPKNLTRKSLDHTTKIGQTFQEIIKYIYIEK